MAEQSEQLPPDDYALVRRIEQQDQQALSLLYERYGAAVYGLALRVAGDQTIAEEATQDTFLKVWNRVAHWDSRKGALISWLLTIARYTTIDRMRQEKRQTAPIIVSLEDTPDPPSKLGIPHDPLRADGRLLRHLLRQLPAEQAELIELAFFQGMTHRDLAETLDIPLGTIKTRVRLGLQKLRVLWLQANQQPEDVRTASEDKSI